MNDIKSKSDMKRRNSLAGRPMDHGIAEREFWINIQPDGNCFVYHYKPEFETVGYFVHVREVVPASEAKAESLSELKERIAELEAELAKLRGKAK